MPSEVVPQPVGNFDKLGHFSMYAVLGWLMTRNIAEPSGRWPSVLLAIIVCSGFGAADEWHQQYIPGRSTELADWQADTVGAAAGALAFASISRRRSRIPTIK